MPLIRRPTDYNRKMAFVVLVPDYAFLRQFGSDVLRIWQAAPLSTKKAHLAVKVQFDYYLDHGEFKSKLPMLLQSEHITGALAGTSRIRSIQLVFRS